jgi:hypothetical protein
VALGLDLASISVCEVHTHSECHEADSPHYLHEWRGGTIRLDREPKNRNRRKADELKHWPSGGRAKQLDEEWRVCGHD